jgi:hypothetical protein
LLDVARFGSNADVVVSPAPHGLTLPASIVFIAIDKDCRFDDLEFGD